MINAGPSILIATNLMLLFSVAGWGAPSSLQVHLEPCLKLGQLNASGTVTSTDGYWKAVTVKISVGIKNGTTDQTRIVKTEIGVTDIPENTPRSFSGSFFQSPKLEASEAVTSCTWTFGGGTRISLKPATVTASDVPAAKDHGCFVDYLKASRLEGLERRKQFAELLQYGCIFMIPSGTEALESKSFIEEQGGVKTPATSAIFQIKGVPMFGMLPSAFIRTENIPYDDRLGPDVDVK